MALATPEEITHILRQLRIRGVFEIVTQKGVAGGYASLDGTGKVPASQLPAGGGGGSGSVTSVSVASANGFAGSVANASTTPAITISTSITGLLKGNGTALSAAIAGTDYETPGTAASLLSAHVAAADPHPQYALDSDLASYVPSTRTVNGHALSANVTVTASDVGLGSVTNDAQTKAAVVPNTVPSAGQIHVGNAGGTAFAVVGVSGDAALTSAGALTVSKTGGVAFAASATTDTTNAANIGSGTLPAGRLPAHSGDVTSSAGSASLTVTKINGVSLAGLATGILKNTTTTGVPLIAVAGTDYVAPGGALGTPSSGTLTNCTGLPIASGVSGLASGVASFLASPTSANMSAMLTDETGSGSNVFGTAPDVTNIKLLGTTYMQQGAPASKSVAATLTGAEMLGGIIQYTGAAAALTLPTGTLMDSAVTTALGSALAADRAFEVCFVNTGSGAVTITAGTGFTIVGSATVTNGTSARYRCRKTAANTWVAYRIG